MKLKIIGIDNEIDLENKFVNVIEIKDVKFFRSIVNILNNKINNIDINSEYENDILLIDDQNQIAKMNEKCHMVIDIFNIDYNSKKILNKIYDKIEENIKNNQDYEIDRLMLNVRDYLIQEVNELPIEFVMKDDIQVTDILKIFSLKIDESCYKGILEKIEILIEILATLKLADILILTGIKMYLEDAEIIELYKYSLYNNIKLVILERDNKRKLEYEQILKIDENFNDYII